jgi:hypothetical protein
MILHPRYFIISFHYDLLSDKKLLDLEDQKIVEYVCNLDESSPDISKHLMLSSFDMYSPEGRELTEEMLGNKGLLSKLHSYILYSVNTKTVVIYKISKEPNIEVVHSSETSL